MANVANPERARFDPLSNVLGMPDPQAAPAPHRWRGAAAGATAVAAALASGELVAALAGEPQTPVLAVGAEFVDRFAASLKEVAVAIFGTNDKPALVTGTVVVTLLLGAAAGALGRGRAWLVPGLVAVLASVGLAAQLADPRSSLLVAVVTAVVSTLVGWLVWRGLSGALERRAESGSRATPSRRHFLALTGAVAVAAAGMAAISRLVAGLRGETAAMPDAELPEPGSSVPIPDTAAFEADGVSPYVTDNDDFYRIDTALTVPRVDVTSWTLRVEGMVDAPLTIGYEELLAMPSVERPVTLQCVSNEVGGDLVDNAVWQGVPLLDVLEMAGVQGGAEQVFSTSVDGWTCGFPLAALSGERTALLAYAMNGEPLPPEHGFPVRLVVAGLYGYVSATKWLESIELTTWDGRDGFWVPRGWAKEGPIKLASRIDVPGDGEEVAAGSVVIGGVAWLPATGVGGVEVRLDGGEWRECELAPVANEDTWVQWRLRVELEPGRHVATVRAIDADGRPQDEAVRPPAPDGATGLHEREFDVVG